MALYDYRGENHDWDLTLGSAKIMLDASIDASDNISLEFAAQASSMLLSLTGVESFTNSLAFLMPKHRPDLRLNARKFRNTLGFWPKINMVCRCAGVRSSADTPPFDVISEAHGWRNLLVHTQPYSVSSPAITNTTDAVHELHAPYRTKEYAGRVSRESAERYLQAARTYVSILMEATGIEPRAMASYTLAGQEVRIVRKTPY